MATSWLNIYPIKPQALEAPEIRFYKRKHKIGGNEDRSAKRTIHDHKSNNLFVFSSAEAASSIGQKDFICEFFSARQTISSWMVDINVRMPIFSVEFRRKGFCFCC